MRMITVASHPVLRLLTAPVVLIAACCFTAAIAAGEPVMLGEAADADRLYAVDAHVQVDGTLETAAGEGKSIALKLNVAAAMRYRERRLSGTGRDALTLRALRWYDVAESKIEVDRQTTFLRLGERAQTFVAQGRREGMMLYGLQRPLRPSEVDLLQVPGDSLAIAGLLPPTPVEVGQEWTPESWSIQMLTATEAVLKNSLTCTLKSVDDGIATVGFKGEVEGAVAGAATEIQVQGTFTFDVAQQFLRTLEMTQTEKRSVGAVSPGMDVTATVKFERTPTKNAQHLEERIVTEVPLDPKPDLLALELRTPWNVAFQVSRDWHLFHQTPQTAILRLLDAGSLVAQLNISQIRSAAPGQHTSGAEFQEDIAALLGERLEGFIEQKQLESDSGGFLYRVVADGKSGEIPIRWFYYLTTAPDGRQTSMVFTVEKALLETFGTQHADIARGLKFLDPPPPPKPAER